MKFYFYSIFTLVLISIFTLLIIDSMTGNAPVTPNCGAQRTYAFYRTLEEKESVEYMWRRAGFVPTVYEEAPDSFQGSGYKGFFCLRRMTKEELAQDHMLRRQSVVTIGSSYSLNKT